jgi:hypothetical protein
MMLLMMMPALPHRGVRQSAREAARVDEVRMQLLWDSWCGVERKRGSVVPEMGCMRRQGLRPVVTEAATGTRI